MSIQFSFGNGLLRSAVLLGFLGCLVAQGTPASQAALAEPIFSASQFANLTNADVLPRSAAPAGSTSQIAVLSLSCSDSLLTVPVEIGPTDDDVAFEDSIEMVQVGAQQRTFGIDQVMIGPKVASNVARNPRAGISPPLLV